MPPVEKPQHDDIAAKPAEFEQEQERKDQDGRKDETGSIGLKDFASAISAQETGQMMRAGVNDRERDERGKRDNLVVQQ